MDIEKFVNSKEISQKKLQKISMLKQEMQKDLVKIKDFGDRLEYVTFVIHNIFSVINDEEILTFKKYKSLVKVKNRVRCKKLKKLKKIKGWKK
jgi:hypothetical protein